MNYKKGILGFVYQRMMFCYKKLHLWKLPVPGRNRVKADLNRIHPGENSQECLTDYYVKKMTLSVVILAAGVLFVGIWLFTKEDGHITENGWVYRGSAEDGMQKYNITGQTEDGGSYTFPMEVAPRRYTGEELETLYGRFEEELPELILGGNTSPEQITGDLELSDTYAGFPFWVEWKSDVPEVVGDNGTVRLQQEPVSVHLKAESSYEEYVRVAEVMVTVAGRNETAEEREKSRIAELLQQAQEEDPENERFQLPGEIDGKVIRWKEDNGKTGWMLAAGCVLAAVAVFFFQDRDLHDLVEKKKRDERRTYPEILQKLTLYLQAGLTVRAAFCRVAEDYEREKAKGGHRLEAYEEMLITTREIRMGIPERTAYEGFGKRTGIREYVRLSTFLLQNLKKGSTTLLGQLQEETRAAEELRMQNARKLSEEAATKLLLPMVLLLVIVMVMIMVPAFSNAGV